MHEKASFRSHRFARRHRPDARRARRVALGALGLLALFVLPSSATAAPPAAPPSGVCADPSGVCVEGASYKADSGLTDAARKKEAKRYRKRKALDLSVALTSGRGSVFVDGVWVGVAPVQGFSIKPGKHDIEVRDGSRALASGVMTISSKAKGAVSVVVRGSG